SLEALETFIAQQKALLARTQTDLETLRRLKTEAITDAATSSVAEQVRHDETSRLVRQVDCAPQIPQNIDWDLFSQKDPSPFKSLAKAARTAYTNRNIPSPVPRSDISQLQKFVREARSTILDPVLSKFKFEDEDKPPTSPQISVHGHRMPLRGPSGLFTRRVAQAEHADDASTSTTVVGSERSIVSPVRTRRATMMAAIAATAPPPPPAPAPPAPAPEPPRPRLVIRIPARKPQPEPEPDCESYSPTPSPPPKRFHRSSQCIQSPTPEPEPTPELDSDDASEDIDPDDPPTDLEEEPEPDPPLVLGKRKREKKAKIKPETYKLSWSASEQNLLERLLEQIPVGDPRSRFLKISNAMEGRRTPRQVSSRVQKYMQKLKKFGLA
ncbi:hypothetical protein FB45DRAFT_739252, partial [Roridomyces roridus]